MPYFSKISKERLLTCHDRLQEIFNEVIKEYDCSITCGYRGEEEQNKEYSEGDSELKYPYSKHNATPSLAVDVVPYPSLWKDNGEFEKLAKIVKRIANEKHIFIEWGGDWKSIIDKPHWELI